MNSIRSVRSLRLQVMHGLDEILGLVFRRVLRGAMIVFSWFCLPYSYAKSAVIRQRKLPPIRNRLLLISATKLAEMIRNREVTSEEVIQAYIDRCNEINPLVNAIVEDRFEQALEEARAVDRHIRSGTRTPSELEAETPLLGLPVTVKESIAVQGLSHQAGRLHRHKRVAAEDAPAVVQVKKHGGIVLLVSNTPELCMLWETYNKVTGLTCNPYDLQRTSGGSSGGEAALIAGAGSLMGLCSDIAGSSRLPAMFTGIFGHKPSPYAVSTDGHVPNASAQNWGQYFTIAPMARYAADLPLLLRCMIDPSRSIVHLDNDPSVKSIKFYYMPNDGPSGATLPLEEDVERAIVDVAQYFGAKLVNIDGLKWSLDISMSAMLRIPNVETIYYERDATGKPITTIMSETFKYLTGRSESTFPSVIVGHLQAVVHAVPEKRHRYLATVAAKLKAQFNELLGSTGVFIYPTFPNTAHKHFQVYHKLVEPSYMMVFNTLGMPVTNCMVRLDRNQLPIGVQIVANPGMDHLTLAVAREIERKFGGWTAPPSE